MRWGLVTTTNAPLPAVQAFVAHHLSLGADRLWLFLDAPAPEVEAAMKAHPAVKVIATDEAYWARKGSRPEMHQPRQAINARHAYNRSKRLDWLGHIDIDEFLWPEDGALPDQLAALPPECLVTRVRPVEALSPVDGGEIRHFKATPIDRKKRAALTGRLYPDYAGMLDDGFLSHVAGKVFVRTGHAKVRIKIHNASVAGEDNPGQVELTGTSLCHLHAEDWQTWRARFDYRLEQGAYRASLGRKAPTGLNLHQFFQALIAEGGEEALRAFHAALCTATPAHLEALEAEGMLRTRDLQLSTKTKQFFPGT